jgi:hypothetical protein
VSLGQTANLLWGRYLISVGRAATSFPTQGCLQPEPRADSVRSRLSTFGAIEDLDIGQTCDETFAGCHHVGTHERFSQILIPGGQGSGYLLVLPEPCLDLFPVRECL